MEFLIIPLLILLFIIAVASMVMKKRILNYEKDLITFFSREDFLSQLFFLLSIFFFAVFLFALNKDFNSPLSSQAILMITSIIGILIAYYYKLIFTLNFSLIGISCWWMIQGVAWAKDKNTNIAVLFLGIVLIFIIFYLLGAIHKKHLNFKRAGLVYKMFGIFSITILLFIASSKSGLEFVNTITQGELFFHSWQLLAAILVIIILFLICLIFSLRNKFISYAEVFVISVLAITPLIISFLPEQMIFLSNASYYSNSAELTAIGILWALIFNILAFFELLGIIFLGYKEHDAHLINLAVFFFFIFIVIKYFDWFFSFMDKSAFFIGAGILLFVVGWFMEKGRKYVLAEMEKEKISN